MGKIIAILGLVFFACLFQKTMKVAQWLDVLPAIVKDLCLVPSTQSGSSQQLVTPGNPMPLFLSDFLPQVTESYDISTHRYIYTHICECKI